MGQFAVILAAAGRSTRFGDPREKKIYAELEGRAVWLRALDPFLTHGEVEQIIVAIAPEDREMFNRRYHDKVAFLNLEVVEGGAQRSDTVARALELVRPVCQFVAIHDAARPCLTEELVSAVFAAAREHGAALLATPVIDTIKQAGDDRFTTATVPRANLYLAQTPQVFRRDWLDEAYARRGDRDAAATDDTQLVEALGHRCAIVPSTPLNLKITTQQDLGLAGAIVRLQSTSHRPSCGHPFADENAMWAGLPKLKPSDVFGP
jgi:2-C-methyl-D-erythritol 4-phosphate cytidylyltransferase